MSDLIFEKSVVDASLGDLATAYELVAEIHKASDGDSAIMEKSSVAACLIEKGFQSLAHYGNAAIAKQQKDRIEKTRIIATASS